MAGAEVPPSAAARAVGDLRPRFRVLLIEPGTTERSCRFDGPAMPAPPRRCSTPSTKTRLGVDLDKKLQQSHVIFASGQRERLVPVLRSIWGGTIVPNSTWSAA